MLECLEASTHRIRIFVQTRLHGIDNVARVTKGVMRRFFLRSLRCTEPSAAGAARGSRVQDQSIVLVREAVGMRNLTRRTKVMVLFRPHSGNPCLPKRPYDFASDVWFLQRDVMPDSCMRGSPRLWKYAASAKARVFLPPNAAFAWLAMFARWTCRCDVPPHARRSDGRGSTAAAYSSRPSRARPLVASSEIIRIAGRILLIGARPASPSHRFRRLPLRRADQLLLEPRVVGHKTL